MKNWIAKCENGQEVSEHDINWEYIKNEVVSLQLNNDGQKIILPKEVDKFIQGKTASAFIGSSNINIESRYIGFIVGNITVKIRVDEQTNNISIEVIEAEK